MITLSNLSLALALTVSTLGCSVAGSAPDPEVALEAEAATLPVEDVAQYASCLDNGHSGLLDLGQLNADRDPATRATFATASCIVGRLTQFQGKFRPYNLQSFKNLAGEQRFFFKRVSFNTTGEAAPQCLKIKMTAVVGPTDAFVTITRVKQLPPPRADGLCEDAGEV